MGSSRLRPIAYSPDPRTFVALFIKLLSTPSKGMYMNIPVMISC